jgi:hypothetical protein
MTSLFSIYFLASTISQDEPVIYSTHSISKWKFFLLIFPLIKTVRERQMQCVCKISIRLKNQKPQMLFRERMQMLKYPIKKNAINIFLYPHTCISISSSAIFISAPFFSSQSEMGMKVLFHSSFAAIPLSGSQCEVMLLSCALIIEMSYKVLARSTFIGVLCVQCKRSVNGKFLCRFFSSGLIIVLEKVF